MHFIAKGKMYLFTVRNGYDLLRLDVRRDREKVQEYDQVKKLSQKHGKIVSIQRYSAYILV